VSEKATNIRIAFIVKNKYRICVIIWSSKRQTYLCWQNYYFLHEKAFFVSIQNP
jgi:hypothetical protein